MKPKLSSPLSQRRQDELKVSKDLSMGEGGQFRAHLFEVAQIDLSKDNGRQIGGPSENPSPWIYDHRVAIGGEALWVLPDLVWGNNVDLILDGPRAQ